MIRKWLPERDFQFTQAKFLLLLLITSLCHISTLKKLRGKRTVVISRSTFASAGRYGGHWLGDNTARFSDLYLSIPGKVQKKNSIFQGVEWLKYSNNTLVSLSITLIYCEIVFPFHVCFRFIRNFAKISFNVLFL